MKKIIYILCLLITFSCKTESKKEVTQSIIEEATEQFEIVKPKNAKALLIVLPGGGANAKATKHEFKIVEPAKANNIAVLLMNQSRLWLTDEDSKNVSNTILEAIKTYHLPTDNVVIGGMSLGGSNALSVSNYLLSNSDLKVKGTFVVDSPIDLYALYESSIKDLKRSDFSEERLAEPKFIVRFFEEQFGKGDDLLTNIQKVSPVTIQTKNLKKIDKLKAVKLALYTEPDTLWWKQVRQTDFESTNAFTIQQTYKAMQEQGWQNVKLFQTKDKGYRSNGDKHPHSWSIVDVNQLIKWIETN